MKNHLLDGQQRSTSKRTEARKEYSPGTRRKANGKAIKYSTQLNSEYRAGAGHGGRSDP